MRGIMGREEKKGGLSPTFEILNTQLTYTWTMIYTHKKTISNCMWILKTTCWRIKWKLIFTARNYRRRWKKFNPVLYNTLNLVCLACMSMMQTEQVSLQRHVERSTTPINLVEVGLMLKAIRSLNKGKQIFELCRSKNVDCYYLIANADSHDVP